MTLYVDTSALLKRYIDEAESETCERHLLADPTWITARHTWVEVRRNLARLCTGETLVQTREAFEADWARLHVIELDEETCAMAADIAEVTLARTLDALHLGALRRAGASGITLITFDVRQARAARELGLSVIGV